MNNRIFLSFFVLVALLFQVHPLSSSKDTQKRPHNQLIAHQYEIPDYFHRPLEYSDASFSFFIKRIYNHRRYPQYFLAVDFMHVLSGISLANQADHPRRYMAKFLRLFDHKLQLVYINPYAFLELLERVPAAMTHYCNVQKETAHVIDSIKECIGSCLVDDFKSLKENPEATLNELAHKLYTITAHTEEKDISIRELQHEFHYFVARGLGNLVWNPGYLTQTWNLVKTIAVQLEKCAACSLLDEEMLDNLYWILLQRYAYFVDLCATDFDQSFFDIVQKDLRTEKCTLWSTPEQVEYITPKLDFIQNAFIEAEIKFRASTITY